MSATFPITGRKIRLGIVGSGRISKNHIQSLKALANDIEIVGICDPDATALKNGVQETGAAGFASMTEMLAKTKLDLVTLCTPSGLHPEEAMEAAKAKVHVVSEKPMACSWDMGVKMVQTCESEGVKLFIVKQNRYNATIRLLKKAIDQGRFGKLYMCSANVFWTRPQEYYDASPWRGTWELDGGAYMNQASHYVDQVQWLMGPIQSVSAFTGTLARKIQAEDTGVTNIKFRSGAFGSISVTMLTYPKNLEGSITIFGEKGTVRIGGTALNKVEAWHFADSNPELDEAAKSASYEIASVYGFGHQPYYENVVSCLRGAGPADVDGRAGLKSLELLCSIYESARNGGRVVELPYDWKGLDQ